MYNKCMERTQIYITEKQQKKLKKMSKDTGLSMSELIRRALDEYLNGKKPLSQSNPNGLSEPLILSNPERESEPSLISNPKRLSEPRGLSNPDPVSEPWGRSNPLRISEPE